MGSLSMPSLIKTGSPGKDSKSKKIIKDTIKIVIIDEKNFFKYIKEFTYLSVFFIFIVETSINAKGYVLYPVYLDERATATP